MTLQRAGDAILRILDLADSVALAILLCALVAAIAASVIITEGLALAAREEDTPTVPLKEEIS